MFGKKKKEENKTPASITGTISHSVTTTQYSSVTTSKMEIGMSKINSGENISAYKPNLMLLGSSLNNSSFPRPRVRSVHEIDATPFNKTNSPLAKSTSSSDVGYQSPFSRRLPPYRSVDARPFNTGALSNPSSGNSTVRQSASLLSPPTSYRPLSAFTTPKALTTAPSTQSLPCGNEASKVRDPRVPTYDTNGKNRGRVLVINNINFLQAEQERKGAETDEKNISKLFKGMGFSVDTFKNLKKGVMLEKVKKFKNDSSLKKVDISIVILMSHGSNVDENGKIVRGGFTQIYGIDDVGLPIDDILNEFSSENCPGMAGKPKIFIFQCCRGSRYETLHNDAAPIKNKIVKKHGDMLVAFSTLPGFYSIRDTRKGSWYIECICDVFKKHAKEFDVETLLKIVDDQLSKKHPEYQQTSTYESRGFKCCYLNPK